MEFQSDSDDEIIRPEPISIPIEKKSWDAAFIDMKYDGKWMRFYDKRTKKPLNEPPPISQADKTPRRYYQRKGYQQKPREIPEFQTPHDNYKAFKVRKRYTMTPYDPSRSPRNEISDNKAFIDLPNQVNSHRFAGDNPYKCPFRRSTYLLNEQRMKEMEKIHTKQYKKRAPKIPNKQLPSLFERSIHTSNSRFEL